MPTRGFQTGSGRALHYDPTIDATSRTGPFANAPLLEWLSNPNIGSLFHENWSSYVVTDEWVLTQSTTGTAAVSTAASHVLELDSGSTTVVQGPQILRIGGPFIIPVAGQIVYAEFEVKVVDTFDKAELFIGLSEVDTTIIATSANSSANHVGWQCVTDDGVLLFTSEKAGTGDTGAAATIAEATYIRLGFVINGITSVTQFINGVESGTAKVTANVPIVKLVPSFVCQSGGTNDPILHIKPFTIFTLFA